MAYTNIKLKRSATAGKVPLTTDLDLGEIAVNTYDGKLYIKKDNGTESVVLIGPTNLSDLITTRGMNKYVYTATAAQTTFSGSDDNSNTLAYTAGQIQVYYNGALLDESDYTATNGTSVVLGTGADGTGDIITIIALYTSTISNASDLSITGNLDVSGDVTIGGNITLGNADTDSINITADLTSNLIPNANNTYDLGSSSKEWKDLYLSGTASVAKTRFTTNNTTYWDLRRDSNTGHFVISDDGLGDVFTILQSNGNVGIGTSSPAAALDVSSASNGNRIILRSTVDPTSIPSMSINTQYYYTGTTYTGGSQIVFEKDNATAGNYGHHLQFWTRANGSPVAERMRIDSSGNVGIGESAPLYKLDVNGANTSGIVDVAAFTNPVNAAGTGHGARILLHSTPDAGRGVAIASSSNTNYATDNNMLFYTSVSSTLTERMRIDSSGNLLVGRTSTLTFSTNTTDGVVLLPSRIDVSAASLCRISQVRDATGTYDRFYNGANIVGSITCTTSATAYNTSSDQRLKENISDADDAGSKIDAIQVRQFDWKVDGSHQGYGMIAQELVTVAPEAVSQPEDPEEMMGVDYSKLIPMLVKEIQSLRARVAQLEGN